MKSRNLGINCGKIAYDNPDRKSNIVTIGISISYQNISGKRDWETLEVIQNENAYILSVSGEIWKQGSENFCVAGQIQNDLREFLTERKFVRLLDIWDEYHLNDMQVGTKLQDEYIKKHKKEHEDNPVLQNALMLNHYQTCRKILETNGMFDDRGYVYGEGWLFKRIPESIIKELYEICGVKYDDENEV